uniref:Uncharacterized protein n=1 Tax=Plectus sambesii TaxID=2011161 RepID=A0A914VYH1_9BILA
MISIVFLSAFFFQMCICDVLPESKTSQQNDILLPPIKLSTPSPLPSKTGVNLISPVDIKCAKICASYWKCIVSVGNNIAGSCSRPIGCACACFDESSCAVERIQRDPATESKPLPDDSDLEGIHMPLMPNRGQRVCQKMCVDFRLCLRYFGHSGANGQGCPEPAGCNCV